MSKATVSQNLARFLMVFGFVLILSTFAVSLHKASIVRDVYEEMDTFQGTTPEGLPDPATSTDAEVREDWQNVMTIAPWEALLRLLGIASLLTSILLIFRMGIFEAEGVVQIGLPRFWQAYLAGTTGDTAELRESFDPKKLQEAS